MTAKTLVLDSVNTTKLNQKVDEANKSYIFCIRLSLSRADLAASAQRHSAGEKIFSPSGSL
jgi:hypothetical protein